MMINSNALISITEANQNFSRVAKLVDENGSAVIMKNNSPRYLIIDFTKAENTQIAKDEDVCAVSKRILQQNLDAYQELSRKHDSVK